jgi:hypothetical protein
MAAGDTSVGSNQFSKGFYKVQNLQAKIITSSAHLTDETLSRASDKISEAILNTRG